MKPDEKFIMSLEQQLGASDLIPSSETPGLDSIINTDQPLDPANLIFDLNDLLRRDPTLSSLSSNVIRHKDVLQPSSSGIISANVETGVPIPKRNLDFDSPNDLIDHSSERISSVLNTSHVENNGTRIFGSSYGSGFDGGPTSPEDKSSVKVEMDMSMDVGNVVNNSPMTAVFFDPLDVKQQPTLAQLNSPPLDTELNWDSFFTNDEAKNVTLSQTLKPSTKSTFSQPIKTEYPSDIMLSSSFPAPYQNGGSPLSDILIPDLNPASPAKILAVSPRVIGGDPPPRSASFSGQRPVIIGPASGKAPSNVGPERVSTLHKLLLAQNRPSPVRSPESRNSKTLVQMKNTLLSASNPLLSQQLSKSAPSQHSAYLDRLMWSRREPRPHINSVCSVGGESSITDEVNEVLNGLSPTDLPDIASDDEEYDGTEKDKSLDDSSNDDLSEDDDFQDKSFTSSKNDSKKERHFWQYNVQAKGPKGQKIVLETKIEDPHELNDIVDPVFAGDVKLQGIKHSGKARRGDGNDLTSNPKKLASIGKELEQLSKIINDLTPVSEMPFAARCKSRKEKNKLASRACRLKKKAQHEANKLKCCGLRDEHQMLIGFINRSKAILKAKLDSNNTVPQAELTAELDHMVKKAQSNEHKVAGETTEFVNRQIEKYLSM